MGEGNCMLQLWNEVIDDLAIRGEICSFDECLRRHEGCFQDVVYFHSLV
jgi:hypothetical protein